MNKLLKSLILFAMLIITIPIVNAQPNVSISAPSSVKVGETVKVTVSVSDPNQNYSVKLNISASGAARGSDILLSDGGNSSKTLTLTPSSTGSINISVNGDWAQNAPPFTESTYKNGKTITVVSSSNSSNSGGSSTPSRPGTGEGLGTGSYNSDVPKDETVNKETEEERKARELEERKKVPLIKSIKVYSESERLKGEVVSEVNTEDSKFEYGFTLPRGVDAFKLDLTPLNDKVKLDYKQMYKLDAGHDKVDIIVKATDGEISQEFKFQVKKSAESKVAYSFGDRKYT
ncbi:MAG: hypothetical protein GX963_11045, partial [Bacteroidales bacterium]|nr:hypothetical protein [Bacteroidales bacterium]